ncbi:hypothetical protein PGB90_000302 [Kerria lacca]
MENENNTGSYATNVMETFENALLDLANARCQYKNSIREYYMKNLEIELLKVVCNNLKRF